MAPSFRSPVDPLEAIATTELTSLSRPVVREPQRRHRWLTASSGWLLFACMFLPAWRPCATAEPLPIALVPYAWPPYVVGLMIALVASARVRGVIEARGALLLALVRFVAIAVAGFALVSLLDDGVMIETAVAVKISTVIALLVPWRGTEAAIATTSVVTAAGIAVFTALVARDPLAVWGAFVGVGAACVLLVGCVWWWIEVHLEMRADRWGQRT